MPRVLSAFPVRPPPARPLTAEEKLPALLALIRDKPGLDGPQLARAGWQWKVHGSLRDAEAAGLIRWDGPPIHGEGGWHVAS